jgi:1-acyl-sn-glycerol-3-phosphate acyltransferase
MIETLQHSSYSEQLAKNEKIVFPNQSNTRRFPKVIGALWYYWSLSILAFFFLFAMPPIMLAARFFKNPDIAYPWARWGAMTWLWGTGIKVVVTGAEHLKPGESYIFVSNHRSYLDTAAMFAYTGKKMGVIAKKEMLKLPIAGKFMSLVNLIAIDRTNAESAIASMNKAREVMRSGVSFGIYAEGTRAMRGELLPFKKGAFHLALQTGSAIVPIAVRNTDVLMGKKQKYAQPGTMEFVMLPPVATEGLTAENDLEDLMMRVRAMIAAELEKQI